LAALLAQRTWVKQLPVQFSLIDQSVELTMRIRKCDWGIPEVDLRLGKVSKITLRLFNSE